MYPCPLSAVPPPLALPATLNKTLWQPTAHPLHVALANPAQAAHSCTTATINKNGKPWVAAVRTGSRSPTTPVFFSGTQIFNLRMDTSLLWKTWLLMHSMVLMLAPGSPQLSFLTHRPLLALLWTKIGITGQDPSPMGSRTRGAKVEVEARSSGEQVCRLEGTLLNSPPHVFQGTSLSKHASRLAWKPSAVQRAASKSQPCIAGSFTAPTLEILVRSYKEWGISDG